MHVHGQLIHSSVEGYRTGTPGAAVRGDLHARLLSVLQLYRVVLRRGKASVQEAEDTKHGK